MLPIVTLLVAMFLALLMGKRHWGSKGTKFFLLALLALLQTGLLVFDMFTMKIPKP